MKQYCVLAKISSRSSNFLDHYSSNTSQYTTSSTTFDYNYGQSYQAPTVETQTVATTKVTQYYEQAPAKGEWKWKWVWHPHGEDSNSFIPQGHYKPSIYQEAQPRQGFLALLNPGTLV